MSNKYDAVAFGRRYWPIVKVEKKEMNGHSLTHTHRQAAAADKMGD